MKLLKQTKNLKTIKCLYSVMLISNRRIVKSYIKKSGKDLFLKSQKITRYQIMH